MLRENQRVLQYELPIKIDHQKEGGFLAACTVWPDCYAQADTIDEAVLEITAVAQSLVELYKEEGLIIPLKLQKQESINNPKTIPVIVAA